VSTPRGEIRSRPSLLAPHRSRLCRPARLRADEVAVAGPARPRACPLDTVARQLAVSETHAAPANPGDLRSSSGVPAAITAVAWAARRGLL